MNQNDYIKAGLKIFGLYGFTGDQCDCPNPHCDAAGKHPITSNWQHTPDWSQEQLETMEEMGQFDSGFGVLCTGYLVVDVDARNEGVDAFMDLCRDLKIDLLSEAGFAVKTGSGGGSMHLYFKVPEKTALAQHHENYKGIDFKSSGYVVGAESKHKSGALYECLHGSPSDIKEAPISLLELLAKPEYHRAEYNGVQMDVTDDDIINMLNCYKNADVDYEEWIRCGMAIHHVTNGDGFGIWDEWSKASEKYDFTMMRKRWHSFGKSANPVTLGSLIHYAEKNGYVQSVEFTSDLVEEDPVATLDTQGIDLKRPPGFVGELTKWINGQCLYPRENLAVAAALTAVGNIAGMRTKDAHDGMTANMFSFCIAGSSTGKEAVQKAYNQILKTAGIASATHGAIKSEQEIIRNLTRHQASYYCIDEFGLVLRKIMNASKGGASYLEGVIGLVMSIYSKADSFLPVSGDVKDAIKKELNDEAAKCRKKIDENEDKHGRYTARLPQVERALSSIDQGLERPFISILGFTTPVTFNALMEYESATNGFLSRAMIFDEPENNPKRKANYKRSEMGEQMQNAISNMYNPGSFNALDFESRVEFYDEQHKIETRPDAALMLDEVYQSFWDMAEAAQSDSGLEAIPRRGYELVGKVSHILAIPDGVRTSEHVRWAYALVLDDINRKIRLAYSNMKEKEAPGDSIAMKIQSLLIGFDEPQTAGVIANRCRPHKKEQVNQILEQLVDAGKVSKAKGKRGFRYELS